MEVERSRREDGAVCGGPGVMAMGGVLGSGVRKRGEKGLITSPLVHPRDNDKLRRAFAQFVLHRTHSYNL